MNELELPNGFEGLEKMVSDHADKLADVNKRFGTYIIGELEKEFSYGKSYGAVIAKSKPENFSETPAVWAYQVMAMMYNGLDVAAQNIVDGKVFSVADLERATRINSGYFDMFRDLGFLDYKTDIPEGESVNKQNIDNFNMFYLTDKGVSFLDGWREQIGAELYAGRITTSAPGSTGDGGSDYDPN